VHDETHVCPAYAFLLPQLDYPGFPIPVGVMRAVERPAYEQVVRDQEKLARNREPNATLERLWNMGETWEAGAAPGTPAAE
jgi:2-oxoglutarate ferredoxin oxidoreductase subunit beta